MTNEELEEKISEKFKSIILKLCKIVNGNIISQYPVQIRALIDSCFSVLSKEKISVSFDDKEADNVNQLCRNMQLAYTINKFSQVGNYVSASTDTLKSLEINLQKIRLQAIYNIMDKIDILLDGVDLHDKINLIIELTKELTKEANK